MFVGAGEKRTQLRPPYVLVSDGPQADMLKLEDGDIARVHREIQAQPGARR